MTHDPFRRRDCLRQTLAEAAIVTAMRHVEEMPGDRRLTDAVSLLSAALDSVGDFVDGVDRRRFVTEEATPSNSRLERIEAALDGLRRALESTSP